MSPSDCWRSRPKTGSRVDPHRADPASAGQTADRLLSAAHDVTLRQATDWAFSVSIGTASWLPEHGKRKAIDLLAQADRALYTAKARAAETALVQTRNWTRFDPSAEPLTAGPHPLVPTGVARTFS